MPKQLTVSVGRLFSPDFNNGEYLDSIAIPEYERIKLYREMIYGTD
jgi:hypothetical protein